MDDVSVRNGLEALRVALRDLEDKVVELRRITLRDRDELWKFVKDLDDFVRK